MKNFTVPGREEVSANNQNLFDNLKKGIGMVPNLYAIMAYSENGLANYLTLQNGKTSLTKKEKEVVNLVVSQENECRYCQSAHTVIGKLNGFTDEQILELRGGTASFDPKLDALARFTKEVVAKRGRVADDIVASFLAAGYNNGSIVDVTIAVADKVVMNYLHNLTQIPIDFPVAPELEAVHA